MPKLSRRKFLYTSIGAASVASMAYLIMDNLHLLSQNKPIPKSTPLPNQTETSIPTKSESTTTALPPGQHEIKAILRWNIDHPGIISQNPKLDIESWKISLDGEIENPHLMYWKEFVNLDAIESISDFHCVEGWSVRNCKWYGVPFRTIVDLVKPRSDAIYVNFSCVDLYSTYLELKEILKDNVLLAYKLNDKFLEDSLGGPMRLVVPEKYGYKSAMWIQKINFTKTKQYGFWEKQGYSDTADVWKDDRFTK